MSASIRDFFSVSKEVVEGVSNARCVGTGTGGSSWSADTVLFDCAKIAVTTGYKSKGNIACDRLCGGALETLCSMAMRLLI